MMFEQVVKGSVTNSTVLLVSRKDCAAMLSLSVRSIDYLIADKRLKTCRVGGAIRIPISEINRISRDGISGNIRSASRSYR